MPSHAFSALTNLEVVGGAVNRSTPGQPNRKYDSDTLELGRTFHVESLTKNSKAGQQQ